MNAPKFKLRVHEYEENRQDGTRTLVSYTPFLRLGAPGVSGHSGEVVYLQHGYVYGEGGDPYDARDLPTWFADALAALTPQARHDVGFTADRVQWYTGGVSARDVWPEDPPSVAAPAADAVPSSPTWKLAWLCKNRHDYQGTGMSRYGKDMRCVDCKHASRTPAQAKRKAEDGLRPRSGARMTHARAPEAALDGAAD